MTFLDPGKLHWLWLVLPPVVLWLFRRQAKQVPVSTLLFFRSLAREHRESAWLRQLKRWLSLAMTLAVIVFAALALARPAGGGAVGAAQGIVFLIDQSASMAVKDKERTRLDAAKNAVLQRLNDVPDTTVASLMVYGQDVDVLLSRSRNRRELVRLLGELAVLPVEQKDEAAWEAARRLALLDGPAEVFHVSDTRMSGVKAEQDGLSYHWEDVSAKAIHNVGISGFDLRPAPLERNRYEGFLRIAAAGGNPTTATTSVEVKVGGRLAHLRELSIKPGEEMTLLMPVDGFDGERIEVKLSTPGDVLTLDDAVLAALPPAKPLVVAWLSENPDPFTELALGAMVEAGRVEMWKGKPKDWPPKDKPDVLVLENWLPDALPDVPMVLLSPIGGKADWLLGAALERALPLDRVRALNPDHTVLRGVPAGRLSLTQTIKLTQGPGLETLWMGADQPLLLAGELQGKRAVVTAFSPGRSEQLALQPAYPLLLGNAVHWCAETLNSRATLKPLHSGALIAATGEVKWDAWDGANIKPISDSSPSGAVRLNRVGIWRTSDGKTGSSILASRKETDVPVSKSEAAGAASSSSGGWSLGHVSILLWLVLALLVLESFLFHRRAVY